MTRPDPTNHQAADRAAYLFKGDALKPHEEVINLIEEVLDYSSFCPVHFAFETLERARDLLIEEREEAS
jgi:hypothetical protein